MEYSVQSSPVVNVLVTNTVTSLASETRFNRDITIGALKRKLELMTGANCGSMQIEIYSKQDVKICQLSNDDALLGSFPIDNGMRLHVIDIGGKSLELEDLSTVKKFELTDEEYSKKSDSVRAFKQRMKLGQFKQVDAGEAAAEEQERKSRELEEKKKAEQMQAGQRCEVRISGQPCKRGTVRYVGTTQFKTGLWVGVEYDEPMGKHDGSVEGKRYFQCRPKYGAFVKANQVVVGDFPELGLDDDMEL